MSVEDIKRGIASLSTEEQNQVRAYLFQLRHSQDAEYQREIAGRLADRDPSHWLSVEEFEQRLDAK